MVWRRPQAKSKKGEKRHVGGHGLMEKSGYERRNLDLVQKMFGLHITKKSACLKKEKFLTEVTRNEK